MKKILITLSIIALAVIGIVFGVQSVQANSSFAYTQTSTATATSTASGIYLGLASTTAITTDSYSSGIPRLNNRAVVLVQLTASSSSSVLGIAVTYSQDGIDYFQDNVNVSTTTAVRNLNTPNSYTLSGNTTSSTTRSAFMIDLPTRYAKVTFTSSTGTSTVWATIIPQREAQY